MQEENKHLSRELYELSKKYKQSFQPDIKKARSRFLSVIESESGSKVVAIRRTNRRRWVGIAAGLLLALGIGLYWTIADSSSPVTTQLVSAAAPLEVTILPDGSRVWLNRNSKLHFLSNQKESKRQVQLEGEAFFEVAPDPATPFLINTPSGLQIEVTGTAFNVQAYLNQPVHSVRVTEGSVKVAAPESDYAVSLRAAESAFYSTDKKEWIKATASLSEVVDWHAEQLNFVDFSLQKVADYLQKQFEVTIILEKPDLKHCLFNATLVANTPEAILEQVGFAFNFEVEKVDSKKYRLNGTCQ